MINGIDISAAGQGAGFRWEPYRGIGFGGVKISEGTGYADPYAKINIAGARAIGAVPIGYHFLHAGMSGAAQAEWFLARAKAAGLKPGDHIAIDAEDGGLDGLSSNHMNEAAAEFTAELRLHFRTFWPIAYTEFSMAPSLTALGSCPLWLANPSGMAVKSIGPWKQVSFEQVGQKGVDTDVFYGDQAALAKLAFR